MKFHYSSPECQHELADVGNSSLLRGGLSIAFASKHASIVIASLFEVFRGKYKKRDTKSVNGRFFGCPVIHFLIRFFLQTIDISQTQTTTSQLNLNNLTSSLLPTTTSIANIIQQQQLQQAQTIIAQPVTNNIQTSGQLQQSNTLQSLQTQVVQNQVSGNQSNNGPQVSNANSATQQVSITTATIAPPAKKQKKKKKKPPKERKPRLKPGEVRLTTALDGSTLYECPDCQVCYPERGILEQHMIGHNLERKFVCDVCNAGLKRKDHVCTICF